jgi:hypothetical protein
MKAAVALAVSVSLLGCFPNNARHRTYAKYAEGASLVTGIVISAVANTGADCDEMMMAGRPVDDCRTTAKWLSTAGVVLILAGLLGFVATISTAEDDSESTPRVISVEKKQPGTGSGAGSGSTEPPPSTTPGTTDGSAAQPAPDATPPPPATPPPSN